MPYVNDQQYQESSYHGHHQLQHGDNGDLRHHQQQQQEFRYRSLPEAEVNLNKMLIIFELLEK